MPGMVGELLLTAATGGGSGAGAVEVKAAANEERLALLEEPLAGFCSFRL